jgi:hypothetical protein
MRSVEVCGDVLAGAGWFGKAFAARGEVAQMKLDSFADQALNTRQSAGDSDASGKIGDEGAVTASLALVNDEILSLFHCNSFKPDCLSTLLSVPFGISTPDLPLMVTVPGFVG